MGDTGDGADDTGNGRDDTGDGTDGVDAVDGPEPADGSDATSDDDAGDATGDDAGDATVDAATDDSGGGSGDTDERSSLRTIADYQFGAGAGDALFPPDRSLRIERTSSGRPQQIHAADGRLVSFGTDGRFTLGLAGGRRLAAELPAPAYRVVIDDESEPFVRDGKNVFAKFVVDVDPAIRPGDEVLVTHERGELVAVGRAELDADAIRDFETGMAVRVREGAPES